VESATITNKRPWYEKTADKHASERARSRKPGQCGCGACLAARKEGYRPHID
jgi:hypothetical protein